MVTVTVTVIVIVTVIVRVIVIVRVTVIVRVVIVRVTVIVTGIGIVTVRNLPRNGNRNSNGIVINPDDNKDLQVSALNPKP